MIDDDSNFQLAPPPPPTPPLPLTDATACAYALVYRVCLHCCFACPCLCFDIVYFGTFLALITSTLTIENIEKRFARGCAWAGGWKGVGSGKGGG